jgi:hypothetical protein
MPTQKAAAAPEKTEPPKKKAARNQKKKEEAQKQEKSATAHVGAMNTVSTKNLKGRKRCEDCQLKAPSFGLRSEGKERWCSGCAKAHEGSVNVKHKMCEGCGLKQPTFGLPGGKARWCGGCAKGNEGAVSMSVQRKCEDCKLKQPNFGLPAEKKSRWCSGCAKVHTGAVNLNHLRNARKCEGCGLKAPHLSLPSDGKKRRWCAGCAPNVANPRGSWRKIPLAKNISGVPSIAKKAEGSPQQKPKATDPPLTSVRGQILPGDGNPYSYGAAEPG